MMALLFQELINRIPFSTLQAFQELFCVITFFVLQILDNSKGIPRLH